MGSLNSLSTIDQLIIIAYFVMILVVGVYFSRKASAGINEYFLGGRKIPWWAIGMSGTASNFDMTGTMVVISFFFAIGLQGFWVAMRGGIALPYGILMIYMGKWLRRSQVMTTAEWMTIRFGHNRAGKLARLLSAISNIIVTISLLVYFVEGAAKFLAIYIPLSPNLCSILMIAIAVIYTTMSGFYGVIYTDIIQEILVLIVSIYIGYQAFTLPDHSEVIASATYPGWNSFIPQWQAAPMTWLDNPLIYQAFGFCIIFWVAKGIFEGAGGFIGGYTPQRFYAARNDREAGIMTAEWILLLLFRWILVIGTVILGLKLAITNPEIGRLLGEDPEKTLPIVVSEMIPSGMRGILIAGMVAAAMSTFDSTINAGVSYWIKDIYQLYINPQASEKNLIRQSYISTIVFAAIALILSQAIANINEIWSWITGPLSAGLAAPIVMRWYWWRYNGYGFAIATAAGLLTSIIIKLSAANIAFYLTFLITLSISTFAGLVGSYLTKPTDIQTLKNFWLRIRPSGFWKTVTKQLDSEIVRKSQLENAIDISNIIYVIIWQLSGVITVISLLLHQWRITSLAGAIWVIFSGFLYFRWYKNLS
ncbi:MAG: sodium:solute symporter [Trichodesmium sp. MAG_R04]|nr:sodium:solute symporter [Trichodesmium sp. MAG_R04]